MGEMKILDKERIAAVAKELKKRTFIIVFDPSDPSEVFVKEYAYKYCIDELLDALEPVLSGMLNLACGDVTLLNDEERHLLDRYASWDRHNHKNRKTAAELIEDNKDDTWGENV